MIELMAKQIEKKVNKEELTKEERDNLIFEDNFDCQSGGNKLEDAR